MNSFRPTAGPSRPQAIREPKNFGRRTEPASIAITRIGQTTEYAVSPVAAVVVASVVAMFAAGYIAATAYLVLRDDLIGMTQARNARLLHEYEDRIATLRANLDRVTSRQLLDQQAIEAKVAELMRRQEMLGGRNSRIGNLIDEAEKRGLVASPAAAPETPAGSGADPMATGSVPAAPAPASAVPAFNLRGASGPAGETELFAAQLPDLRNTAQTETMFTSVFDRIESVDRTQRETLDGLRKQASERVRQIAAALETVGVKMNGDAVGGPFVPLEPGSSFDDHVDALDVSLKAYDTAAARLRKTPVGNPLPGAELSSPFGVRTDPFLGRPALHAGLDFRSPAGAPVRASADGKVVDAGRNGGYGIMVEIDHGGGFASRYAHLSALSVKTGDVVRRGQVVGKVGSTGRSTGPHLHFEVRRNGDATDPAKFLKAGRKVARDL